MDSANKRASTIRILRYVIGAGIIVFALISFSGVCWCALGLCNKWFSLAYIMSYWEIFGLSSAALFGVFIIRSFRKQSATGSGISTNAGNSAETASQHLGTEMCDESTPKWRELYDQLSDEERAKFKEIVRKNCGG